MHKNGRKTSTFVQILCRTLMALRKISSFFIAALMFCSCNSSRYVVFSGYAQGGTYSVKANLKGVSQRDGEIGAHIDSLLNAIDFTLSGYNHESILSKRNAGQDVQTNDLFDEVLALSDEYCRQTDGAFDVWSAPLFDIWGFGFTADSLPPAERIADALLECKEHRKLNFNAIAQGFTSDVIARYLQSIGVKDMLVDIGEIYCSGLNPSGMSWSIGVDNPTDGNNDPGADLRGIWESGGRSCGIVTSGNYRKFYVRDGKKYSHTIDPRTGYPVQHDLLSATIVAPTSAQADAIATACMVMGTEKAREYILAHEELEGYLICSDSTWTSPGFGLRMQ